MQMEPKRGGDSDIDGTTNRVASVTLESDSLSEAPKSFRNKRRKRISRREKSAITIDADKQSIDAGLDHGEYMSKKYKMEWEALPVATSDPVPSDSSTDWQSFSESDEDADDEQSDWPGAEPRRLPQRYKKECPVHSNYQFHLTTQSGFLNRKKHIASTSTKCNCTMNPTDQNLLEGFLFDAAQKELSLKVERISLIKKALTTLLKNPTDVHIEKRGRGMVFLKKFQ